MDKTIENNNHSFIILSVIKAKLLKENSKNTQEKSNNLEFIKVL